MNLLNNIAKALRPQPWKPDLKNDVCPDCGEDKLTGSGENCTSNSKFDVIPPLNQQQRFFNSLVNDAVNEISHTTDGPLTPFVVINRAIRLAEETGTVAGFVVSPLSEALEQVLTDNGWLSEGQETGGDAVNTCD